MHETRRGKLPCKLSGPGPHHRRELEQWVRHHAKACREQPPGLLPVKCDPRLLTWQGSGQKVWAPPQTTSCLPHSGTRHLMPRLGSSQVALPLLPARGVGRRGIPGLSASLGQVTLLPSALSLFSSPPALESFCFCFLVSVATTSLPLLFSFPQPLCHLKKQVSLFFMLMRELKWVGAEGLARRKRTEQAGDRRGKVTSGV